MGKRKSCDPNAPLRRSKRINAGSVPELMLDENVWFNHVFVYLTSSQLLLLGMTCKYFYHLVRDFFEFRVPALNIQIKKELRASDLVPYTFSQLAYCHRNLGLTRKDRDIGAAKMGDLQYFQRYGFERENWYLYMRTAISYNKNCIVRYFLKDGIGDFMQKESLLLFCIERGNMIALNLLQKPRPLNRRNLPVLRFFGTVACKHKQYAMFDYIFHTVQELAEFTDNIFDANDFFTFGMLVEAVEAGQEECLRLIFAHTAGTWASRYLLMAVRRAITYNHVNIIKLLVEEHGVALVTRHYDIAVYFGNIEAIQYLLSRGIEKSTRACFNAAMFNDLRCLQFLHRHGFEWNSDVLYVAIQESMSIECLRYAFENGCAVGTETSLPMKAIVQKNLEALKYCVEVMGLKLEPNMWTYAQDESIVEYLKQMNCPRYNSQP